MSELKPQIPLSGVDSSEEQENRLSIDGYKQAGLLQEELIATYLKNDFGNEILNFIHAFEDNGMEAALKELQRKPLRTFQQRYKGVEENYTNIQSPKWKAILVRLDEIILSLRSTTINTPVETVKKLLKEMCALIRCPEYVRP